MHTLMISWLLFAAPADDPQRDDDTGHAAVAAEEPPQKVKDPIVTVDHGVFAGPRSFTYSAPETANLRSYGQTLLWGPLIRVEVYPLARALPGLASGLGVDVAYQFVPFLWSHRVGSNASYPTTVTRFDAGLRWRFRPVASWGAAIFASVGLRRQTFAVGPAADGSTLDGVPAITYLGLRPGVSTEVPFGNSHMFVFGGLAVVLVLSSGQIISPEYFSAGSVYGVEGEAGIGVWVWGPLDLRNTFTFQRYAFSFTSQPGDAHRAAGAVDFSYSFGFTARLSF